MFNYSRHTQWLCEVMVSSGWSLGQHAARHVWQFLITFVAHSSCVKRHLVFVGGSQSVSRHLVSCHVCWLLIIFTTHSNYTRLCLVLVAATRRSRHVGRHVWQLLLITFTTQSVLNRPSHLICAPFCTLDRCQSRLGDRLTTQSTLAHSESRMLIDNLLCIHGDCSREVSTKYL